MLYERNIDMVAVLLAAKHTSPPFKNLDNTDEENALEFLNKIIEDALYMGDLKEKLDIARATAVRPSVTSA